MRRRRFFTGCGCLGTAVVAGCVTNAFPDGGDRIPASRVFDGFRYERAELVVEFQEDADVERAVLFDSVADVEYETVERPASSVRFSVVFPDRLETYISSRPALRVKAETPDGVARLSVWEPVHGVARNLEPLSDGRARFNLENQGEAPLLVRFVGIYDDVPNPTVDPQADSFTAESFDLDPSVVGIGENRPLTPSRTDLIIPGGETSSFETTYAPFAFPNTAPTDTCDGAVRTGTIAIVHASGGSTAYSFRYRRDGELSSTNGPSASVCEDTTTTDSERSSTTSTWD